MRIVVAVIEWYGENAVSYHVRDALVELGHQVETVSLVINDEVENNRRMIRKAQELFPDMVIVFMGHYLSQETVIYLRQKFNPVMVLWECDDPWRFEQLSRKWAGFFDICVTNDPYSLNLYKQNNILNVLHLPMGCNPNKHFKIGGWPYTTNKSIDVSFVGSGYKSRLNILSDLAVYGLKIWGDRSWAQTSLASCYQGSAVHTPVELRYLYNCSKININTHFRAFEHPRFTGTFTNQRTYEILGCGGFCLTDWRDHTAAEFIEGKHLVFFRKPEELPELVEYYLEHEDERERIAQQGHDIVHGKYTYQHRLFPLLDKVGTWKIDNPKRDYHQ